MIAIALAPIRVVLCGDLTHICEVGFRTLIRLEMAGTIGPANTLVTMLARYPEQIDRLRTVVMPTISDPQTRAAARRVLARADLQVGVTQAAEAGKSLGGL